MRVLGIDTSNYTTSVALADETGYRQQRKLLSVGEGERGLRQSDALFLHTVNLPALLRFLVPMGKSMRWHIALILGMWRARICHAFSRASQLVRPQRRRLTFLPIVFPIRRDT